MKHLALLSFCIVASLFSGCESVSSRVHDRFSEVPPQTKIYAADRRAVYAAGQVAVRNIGLLLGKTSFAQGVIDAYAPIRSGDATRDTRQTTIQIRLRETYDHETEVSVVVSEHTEGKFPGGISEQDLKSHSLYGLYFAALEQVLLENGSIKAPAQP